MEAAGFGSSTSLACIARWNFWCLTYISNTLLVIYWHLFTTWSYWPHTAKSNEADPVEMMSKSMPHRKKTKSCPPYPQEQFQRQSAAHAILKQTHVGGPICTQSTSSITRLNVKNCGRKKLNFNHTQFYFLPLRGDVLLRLYLSQYVYPFGSAFVWGFMTIFDFIHTCSLKIFFSDLLKPQKHFWLLRVLMGTA